MRRQNSQPLLRHSTCHTTQIFQCPMFISTVCKVGRIVSWTLDIQEDLHLESWRRPVKYKDRAPSSKPHKALYKRVFEEYHGPLRRHSIKSQGPYNSNWRADNSQFLYQANSFWGKVTKQRFWKGYLCQCGCSRRRCKWWISVELQSLTLYIGTRQDKTTTRADQTGPEHPHVQTIAKHHQTTWPDKTKPDLINGDVYTAYSTHVRAWLQPCRLQWNHWIFTT